ncbi:pentapeptide repeat-containing protein [Synechococcus sp. ROS8604]|uniref:pentapeptide repeat-containing protein n=1 Tax=Synechococcus sp. ROS8604 TaxID=1442557 RepID=UPI0016496A09|nr:pentapeptide repeat-containing protein [Synechococcus sp. ROS8604]QNI87394.1 pentapeptide repeat-containing protein [Synechococcus sp. ROS8604]
MTAELELSSWLPPEQTLPEAFASGTTDARGANWRGQSLGTTDFSGAALCRVDLRGCDLSGCNLEGADLRLARYDRATIWPERFEVRSSGAVGPGAKLNGAFLNGTDLRGMDLRGASLMGTYLSGADLSGTLLDDVRLVGADLRHAVLRGARCRGARFGGCQLDYADFRGADLTDAGLEGVESIKGADFSLCKGLAEQLGALRARPYLELDCWNPMTRKNTREALESLS